MKFRPSWKFYLNLGLCLLNLWVFVQGGSKSSFWISAFCCACSVIVWKSEKFVFDLNQETLKKAFEKAKKEEESEDADF